MDFCSVTAYSTGAMGPLCHGLSKRVEPEMAMANIAGQSTFDALTLVIEPRSSLLHLDTLLLCRTELCRPHIRFSPLINGGKLTKLDIRFSGIRSGDMQLFKPFRWMWCPVEATVDSMPRWTEDIPIDGSTGRPCSCREINISGAERWIEDIKTNLERGESAAMDLSCVPAWLYGAFTSSHMSRPWSDINGAAQTVREIPVSVAPHGGVTSAAVRYTPLWSLPLPVDGRSTGDCSVTVSHRGKTVETVDIEVIMEVRA